MDTHSHIYKRANLIRDSSLRALCYEIMDENWDDFYGKKITGLGQETAGKFGWELVEIQLCNAEVFKHTFRDTKADWDIVFFMIYVYPAFIGKALSVKEVSGWDYMKRTHIWRDPEYKSYIHTWREYVIKKFEEYPVTKGKYRIVLDIIYDRDRTSMEYTFWYQIYAMLRSNLVVKALPGRPYSTKQ